jgi:hypothetical protein
MSGIECREAVILTYKYGKCMIEDCENDATINHYGFLFCKEHDTEEIVIQGTGKLKEGASEWAIRHG